MLETCFTALDETVDGLVPYSKNVKSFITTMSVKEQNLSPIDEGKYDAVTVKEMYMKSRLFFLSNDYLLHQFFITRMKGERTYFPDCKDIYGEGFARNMTVNISIGFTWTRGGAEMLYRALCGDMCDKYERVALFGDSPANVNCSYRRVAEGSMLVSSGDIKALDTVITALPLVIYMMFAQIWIRRDDDDPNYRMFQYILESCAEQLAGKTVRWIRDYVLLIGVMPSGSLETSHGDSWIVGVIYWLSYIFNVMERSSVAVRRLIWKNLAYRMIAIFVYGDDLLKIYPKVLRDVINIRGFAQYMAAAHCIQMKNFEEFTSVLTYLNVQNNEVVSHAYTGPTYLKRHLIESANFNLHHICPSIAKVVPYRPFPQYQWRAGVPKYRDSPIYLNLSRLIGLAYDTLGVDPISYYFLEYLYNHSFAISSRIVGPDYLFRNLPKWLEEDCKYLRKINYKIVHSNFPTRDELLKLSILDREAHRPKNVGPWQNHLQDYEWW